MRRNTRTETSRNQGWRPSQKRTYEVAFSQKGKWTSREEPPEFPCKAEKVLALVEARIQDGSLELPRVDKPLTAEDKKHPNYCCYHQKTTHLTMVCYTLRRILDKRLKREERFELPPDKPKEQSNLLEEVNLSGDPKTPRTVLISKELEGEARRSIIEVLQENKDVFAWTYEEMPGLDPLLVTHKLTVEPTKKPKNGTIRCCVDYRDLNRACPKDEFPLPNIDTLIDATAGHELFSFMDGFSGYNQIRMSPEDAEKTASRTPFGNFHYVVMPFGLKNAGATYQRAMIAIFHDIIHDFVEDYVDDLVVKSKSAADHVSHLRKVFERCRKYKLKMNPKKYAFAVNTRKFLGVMVHRDGIMID
ncbi:hypothetical protein UlMin_013280 [Ulmus minor]